MLTSFTLRSTPSIQADLLSIRCAVPVTKLIVTRFAVCHASHIAVELVAYHANAVRDFSALSFVGIDSPSIGGIYFIGLHSLFEQQIGGSYKEYIGLNFFLAIWIK